ncbi:MAG: OsmC family protein [FCB group bacterium]|nr:OsmC family protein [FCB group bacterium]
MGNTTHVQLTSLQQDLTFTAESSSGRQVMVDISKEAGGNGNGTSPMELVLEALGGCTGMDILSILKKKRTPFSHLSIRIEGKKRDEHPKSYTDIHLRFVLHSDGGEKALRDLLHAAELSHEKYCSVAHMLKPAVSITFDAEIADE